MAISENNTAKTENKPGVYKHPVSGSELEVTSHPKFGNVKADALVHAGYEWVKPLGTAKASTSK